MTPCLIEDYKWCFVKTLTDQEWAWILRNSSDKTIRWYPIWNEREELDWIGLPFSQILSIVKKDPILDLCSDGVTQLKETLAEIEEEKRGLKRRLMEAHEEIEREKKTSKLRQKRAKWEEKSKAKMKGCLIATDREMCLRRDERNQALLEKRGLKERLKDSQMIEKAL
ncbi:hypothetical protein CR513_00384, partial [Mucuna pruriens]